MNNPYKILLDTFGKDVQFRFAIEEMSELTKAICKYQRKIDTCNNEEQQKLADAIREEIADVLITAEQLAFMFGEDDVKKIKHIKLERALKRAEKKNNEEKL
ncbi:MAG: hypothetical protein J6J24_00805 [Clostridia bacterium]|nr:hypothetical protein [Clostridia bacterium]